jgi:hypothetical protein
MRGHGLRNILSENIWATIAHTNFYRSTGQKKRMCWKCQKDKTTAGGHIKTFKGGPMKFVCKECVEARKEKNT